MKPDLIDMELYFQILQARNLAEREARKFRVIQAPNVTVLKTKARDNDETDS